jgi:hypothetical protein
MQTAGLFRGERNGRLRAPGGYSADLSTGDLGVDKEIERVDPLVLLHESVQCDRDPGGPPGSIELRTASDPVVIFASAHPERQPGRAVRLGSRAGDACRYFRA